METYSPSSWDEAVGGAFDLMKELVATIESLVEERNNESGKKEGVFKDDDREVQVDSARLEERTEGAGE